MTKLIAPAILLTPEVIEVGRQAVEDFLIDLRDSHISTICGNGFVVREPDGSPSEVIRLRTDTGLRIALEAMLKAVADE